MLKTWLWAAVPMLVLGCGATDEDGDGIADGLKDPDTVTVTKPAKPLGSVSGQVLTSDLQALADATVELTIGSQTAPLSTATDDKGNFEFAGVPGGAQVLLTFAKEGYATLRATSTVPSSAGTAPIDNGNASFGPVTLMRLDGSLRYVLVTPQGRPAAGVHATLEAGPTGTVILSNYDQTTQAVSAVVVEALSDEQGLLTFQGIPSAVELARARNGEYRLWVSALDANGDGFAESNGYVETRSAQEAVISSGPRLIQLPAAQGTSGALSVVSGNVASLRDAADLDPLRNMVRPDEPLYFYFNQPVQEGSLLVRLTDEYGSESLPVTTTLGAGGFSATVLPATGVLQAGREYNVQVRAVSANNGTQYSRTGFFFGGDPGAAQPMSISAVRYQETTLLGVELNAGERVSVYFTSPLSAAPAPVYAYLNEDLNGDRILGNSLGEEGYHVGFEVFHAEPFAPVQTRSPAELALFPLAPSGYSSRHTFTYQGVPLANPPAVRVRLDFGALAGRTGGTYESIWGAPVIEDLTATSIDRQPYVRP